MHYNEWAHDRLNRFYEDADIAQAAIQRVMGKVEGIPVFDFYAIQEAKGIAFYVAVVRDELAYEMYYAYTTILNAAYPEPVRFYPFKDNVEGFGSYGHNGRIASGHTIIPETFVNKAEEFRTILPWETILDNDILTVRDTIRVIRFFNAEGPVSTTMYRSADDLGKCVESLWPSDSLELTESQKRFLDTLDIEVAERIERAG